MSSVKDDLEGRSPMYFRIALKIMQPSWANSSLPSNDLPMMIMMMMTKAMYNVVPHGNMGIWWEVAATRFPFCYSKSGGQKINHLGQSFIPVQFHAMFVYSTKCLVCSASGGSFCKLARWLFLQLVTCKATFYLICFCFCNNSTRWRLMRMDWSVSTTFLMKVT